MPRKKGRARKSSILDHLEAHEGREILRRLTGADAALRAKAEELARSLFDEVSFANVAEEVVEEVGALDLDDLGARAGRHSWGYVEPGEAAWELVEEAVKPYMDDVKRRLELGRRKEALEVCKGLVLGLYHVEEKGESEILEYAPDAPAETATWAVDLLKGSGSRCNVARSRTRGTGTFSVLPSGFVDKYVPKWKTFLLPKPSRRRGKRAT